jgi:hypothetical protein
MFRARLEFKRNDEIAMPLDFRVYLKNGMSRDYRIMVDDGMSFMPVDSFALSPWPFYQKVKRLTLNLPEEVSKVEINPDKKLLDVNPFNDNTRKLPRVYWYWLKRQYYFPHTDGYTASVFPFLFYNLIDGLQAGIRTRGNYIYPDYQHRAELLLGLQSGHPALDIWFEHPLYPVNRDIHFVANLYNSSGRRGFGIWSQWKSEESKIVDSFILGWQWRSVYEMDYYPYPVSSGRISFLEGGIEKSSWKPGYLPAGWQINLHGEISFAGGNYSFRTWHLGGLLRLPLPFHQKITFGLNSDNTYGNPPLQLANRLGGGRLFDYFLNPYLRARGSLPARWWSEGHVFEEGGGNIRSLAADWEAAPAHLVGGYTSITLGNPLNTSYQYIPYISDILFSAYTSWATATENLKKFSGYYGEAGLSMSFTRLPFLLTYFDVESIHFDFPFWVNHNIDSEELDFRWVIRLNIRSFN